MAKKTTTAATKKLGAIDRFLALSDAEKDAVYRSLDREIPYSETRPLTPAERKAWSKTQAGLKAAHAARQRSIRSAVANGTKGIQVTIEGGLLADADAFAAAHGLKRAQLVSIGLRMAMAAIPVATSGLAAK